MIATLVERPKGLRFNVDMSRHLIEIGATHLSLELRKDGTIILRPDRLGSKILTNGNSISPVCSLCCADFYNKVALKFLKSRMVMDANWNNRMKAYVLTEANIQHAPANQIAQ